MHFPLPTVHLSKKQLTLSLYLLGFLLYGVVFFLGLNQLSETRRVASSTASISHATNKLVESQTNILNAIKGVTNDTQTTAEQQTAIIICMLQVPIQNRTTDLQAECRRQAGVISSSTDSSAKTPQNSPGSPAATNPSSSNTTPGAKTEQPNNSQLKDNTPPPDNRSLPEKLLDLINPLN